MSLIAILCTIDCFLPLKHSGKNYLTLCDYNMTDINIHCERFAAYYQAYANSFNPQSEQWEHLHLKWEHSLNVLNNAEKILSVLALPQQLAHAARLAALYHDVARFEQYTIYHTFRDQESKNHGLWGSKILKQENFLADESTCTVRLVRAAVCLHNRFALPTGLFEEYRLVTNIVRDADKIDILRVLAAYMEPGKQAGAVTANLPDQPECWSPAVYNAVLAGHNASYTDMRYLNDFRLLVGSWIYALNFQESLKIVAQQGYWHKILSGLPAGKAMDKAKLSLNKALESYLKSYPKSA